MDMNASTNDFDADRAGNGELDFTHRLEDILLAVLTDL